MRLVDVFDPKRNSLNALRLMLAVGVMVFHSFPLTGTKLPSMAHQLLGNVFVDAFFAISGYLILGSWMHRPRVLSYLAARCLRILPAFYIALVATALVLAPLGTLLSHNALDARFWHDAWSYITSNSLLRVQQYGIDGTPLDVPYPGVWNGSLWTLWWEFLCYLGVLALGVTSLLRWRGSVVVAFLLALVGVVMTSYGPVDNWLVATASRFGLMFLAGSLIYTFRDRIPARWYLVGISVVIVMISALLPDYRVIAAIPIAYAVIITGAKITMQPLRLPNDISYGTYIFAFPVQQVLASAGLFHAGAAIFAIVSIAATLPVAAASWFGVERPALRLKTYLEHRLTARSAARSELASARE